MSHLTPLSQNMEGKGRGKGREGGWSTRTKEMRKWDVTPSGQVKGNGDRHYQALQVFSFSS
jgi:hypothetical protein